jgi:hypothetical protein
MAAIEKGLPPGELKPLLESEKAPKTLHWIRKISLGVFFLISALGILILSWINSDYWSDIHKQEIFQGLVCSFGSFALGFAFLVAGLLSRKAEKEIAKTQSPQS